MNTAAGTRPVAVRAVVLLAKAPTGVAEVLRVLMPEGGQQLPEGLHDITINVNGVPMRFESSAEKLVAQEFDYAVSQSLLRERVQAASDTHAGYLVLTASVQEDVFTASNILSNIAARYADDDNGLAVWLPDADLATTDVIYAGEVDQRPANMWFNVMAAKLDESTALAHTIGVGHLGATEVQLRSTTLSAADAFRALRGAVAELLESETLPVAGGVLQIAGVAHTLTTAPSMIGMGDVLEAVPAATAGAPGAVGVVGAPAAIPNDVVDAAPEKRKGWFGRRPRG